MKIHEAQLGLQRLRTLLLDVVETNAEKADMVWTCTDEE